MSTEESALLDDLVLALAAAIARELPELLLIAADLELEVHRVGDPPSGRARHPHAGQSGPGLRSMPGGQG